MQYAHYIDRVSCVSTLEKLQVSDLAPLVRLQHPSSFQELRLLSRALCHAIDTVEDDARQRLTSVASQSQRLVTDMNMVAEYFQSWRYVEIEFDKRLGMSLVSR